MEPSRPDESRLRRLFEVMLLIRAFEPEAERQYKAAKVGGYCHLATGQEATHVGAVGAMRDDDVLITAYRDHGLALARGVQPGAVMAELFGRVDGCAHGRGGSMHLLDVGRNFFGGWGIVGGHLPVATGLALEITRRGEQRAVLCELGDGAVHRMHGERVDGDDVLAVLEAAGRLLAAARDERKPSVLEAMTYRYRGHSVADAGLGYRSKEEIEQHRRHDPIDRAADALSERGALR